MNLFNNLYDALNIFFPGHETIAEIKPAIQRELDAEHYRQARSNPYRVEHKGVYAPRTMQEAGI